VRSEQIIAPVLGGDRATSCEEVLHLLLSLVYGAPIVTEERLAKLQAIAHSRGITFFSDHHLTLNIAELVTNQLRITFAKGKDVANSLQENHLLRLYELASLKSMEVDAAVDVRRVPRRGEDLQRHKCRHWQLVPCTSSNNHIQERIQPMTNA
jgi:hypothetical protein